MPGVRRLRDVGLLPARLRARRLSQAARPRRRCGTSFSRSSGGGRLWQLADLRQEAHDVDDLPLLRDLAVATTADREAGELDVVVGHVPAADGEPGRDVVAFGEL